MVELIRKIIRWIIFFLILLLIIHIIIRLSNGSKTKNVNKPLSSGVKTIKKNNNTNTSTTNNSTDSNSTNTTNSSNTSGNTNSTTSAQEVSTPDTGINDVFGMIIGTIVLGGTTYYICSNRRIEG